MKVEELKKIMKPLIKSCIKEVLLEESGVLSRVIQETIQGIKKELLVEAQSYVPITRKISSNLEQERKQVLNDIMQESREEEKRYQERLQQKQQSLQEGKKILLDTFAKTNPALQSVFEGLVPITSEGKPTSIPTPANPLSVYAPDDPGVDIEKIFNLGKMRF
jgi:hypothetical protein